MIVRQVMQRAGNIIGGFPLSIAKVKAAGKDPTEFFSDLIDDLQKCSDAKGNKLVQTLIALRDDHKKEVTK